MATHVTESRTEYERPEAGAEGPKTFPQSELPARWAISRARRMFDVAVVVAALPIALPVCTLIAIATYFGSQGPVFFMQTRAGRGGRPFSIVKFRTMTHPGPVARGSITTADDDSITSVGRILRRWKLDELPQLWNVLRGEMSLVGPRPRVPDQAAGRLDCRPGITGAASLAFAREEMLLARIPRHRLDSYYANQVIPIKQNLDDAYMARATFLSDIRLLLMTVFRVWIANDLGMISELPADTNGMAGEVLRGEGCD